ncbi:auxin-responsive protein SAUR64-like [Aristolochia californica]|uniref:auxin-responsive protein SAUR64-like n=1 Tax=Aristolochia californica TaxID=171875 RepID=UPI0035D90E4C
MMNPRKLVEIVRRLHEGGVVGRRGMSPRREEFSGCLRTVADKGHFVVYSIDGGRFVVPLEFLGSALCKQLLRMSEEEFGLRSNSPIVLPCEAVVVDYIVSSFQRRIAGDMEKALIVSMTEENVYHQLSLHGL